MEFWVVAPRPPSMAWLFLHNWKPLNKRPKNLIPAMNHIYHRAHFNRQHGAIVIRTLVGVINCQLWVHNVTFTLHSLCTLFFYLGTSQCKSRAYSYNYCQYSTIISGVHIIKIELETIHSFNIINKMPWN